MPETMKPNRRPRMCRVALGVQFVPEALPAAGQTFATLEGAVRPREALAGLSRARVVIVTAAPSYKCPAAP